MDATPWDLVNASKLSLRLLPCFEKSIDNSNVTSKLAAFGFSVVANTDSIMKLSAPRVSNSNSVNNRQRPQNLWGVIDRLG